MIKALGKIDADTAFITEATATIGGIWFGVFQQLLMSFRTPTCYA